jgi:hypothetical protein
MLPRRQVHILAGASGSGKTTLLLQALQAWQRGQSFPISFEATGCAYLVADRTAEEVESKARALGISMEIYGLPDDPTVRLDTIEHDPMKTLELCIQKFREPFDLLVIDPIMLFVKGSNLDYRRVAVSLIAINRLAIQRNWTIIATHHSTKTRSDFFFKRPQDRISGSAAFQAYSGTQLALVEAEEMDKDHDELWVVSHSEPPLSIWLRRDENGWFQVLPGHDKIDILFALMGEEFDVADLRASAAELGISRATLYRILGREVAAGRLTKTQRGTYRKEKHASEFEGPEDDDPSDPAADRRVTQ